MPESATGGRRDARSADPDPGRREPHAVDRRSLRPGEVIGAPGERVINEDRPVRVVVATNTSRRTIWVSSHYPFGRVNPRLAFDRRGLEGYHLDIPAGAALRWGPGETKTVRLVAYAGRHRPSDGREGAAPPAGGQASGSSPGP